MSVASEYDRAEQVVSDVAMLHDIAAGNLDEQRVREAAGSYWSTEGTSCPAYRSQWRPVCWRCPARLSRRGGRQAYLPRRRCSGGGTRSPSTAWSGCRPYSGNSGGSGRTASCGTMSGGPVRTPPTTPTASSPRRCASYAKGTSARSTRHQRRIWNGRAASSAIRPQGARLTVATWPARDRFPARQGQGLVPLSGPGHTPPRMRGCRCPSGRSQPLPSAVRGARHRGTPK